MITYEYLCNNCGNELEIRHSISDNPKKKCPQCKKLTLERLISIPSHVHVKKGADGMKTIGDLAHMNRDSMSTGEQQKKEHDMSQESRVADAKINKRRPDWVDLNMQKQINKMTTNDQVQKFIATGETPSDN
jgi:putative FmdB family regulatory protein